MSLDAALLAVLRVSPAPFLVHVANVIGLCAKEQVVRSDAEFHITTMEDTEVRPRPMSEKPRHAMGRSAVPHEADRSISAIDRGCCPKPAPIRLLDLRPEAICYLHSEFTMAALLNPAPTMPDAVAMDIITVRVRR